MKYISCAFTILIPVLFFLGCSSSSSDKNDSKEWWPEILTEELAQKVYLPDFSYAGYYWGEKKIPEWPVTLNVSDFGAIPNDKQDDTEALKKAFEAAKKKDGPVVLKLEQGKYILTDILYIERDQFVLRGSGSSENGTVIYMPQPLNKLDTPADMIELEEYLEVNDKRQKEPERGINERFSLYAWSGGYIWTRKFGERAKPYMSKYHVPPVELAVITDGKRGTQQLQVKKGDKLKPGQTVRLRVK